MNKKAIVFGGSGFIGSFVSDLLAEKGYSVTVFDIKESPYLKPGQEMVIGDITEAVEVKKAVKDAPVIYNFAGIADIEEASRNPIGTITQNILGNANILEAIKDKKIERYVFASTLYVYSEAGSFYRDSKIACELYIQDYHEQYGIPYTILRFGSIYGPRSHNRDRIHMLVWQALTEQKMVYNGSGEDIREYIHVEDAARCAVEILEKNYLNQHVIISGQQSLKIKDLMVMIKEILGRDIAIEFTEEVSDIHYQITPYSFNPKLGKKYISDNYIDLGEGIIQCAQEIYNFFKEEKIND